MNKKKGKIGKNRLKYFKIESKKNISSLKSIISKILQIHSRTCEHNSSN